MTRRLLIALTVSVSPLCSFMNQGFKVPLASSLISHMRQERGANSVDYLTAQCNKQISFYFKNAQKMHF